MEWYSIIALCLGQLVGALIGLIAWDKWREDKRSHREEEIAKELLTDGRLGELIDTVEEFKKEWNRWFPTFGPADLSKTPPPGLPTTLRDINHRLVNLEAIPRLVEVLSADITTMRSMMSDGTLHFKEVDERLERLEKYYEQISELLAIQDRRINDHNTKLEMLTKRGQNGR